MFSKIIKISFGIVIVYYLFHFLFFWVFESTDSYFYWAFAQFLKTGKYFAPAPYNYNVPSTMEPPLYSLFLYLAQIFPRADIIIHLVQIAAIVISGILILKIFEKYTKSEFAFIIATSFLLTPAHSLYISNLVAEPIAILFITSYLYLVHKAVNEKKTHLLSWLLVLSSVAVLQRYNLIVFYGFTVVLLIVRFLFPPPRGSTSHTPEVSLSLSRYPRGVIGLLVSIVILTAWILINHNLNGSWGLSNAEGKHLYNRIFHFDRLLPPADDPSFVKFKSIVGPPTGEAGENIDYFKPWWFYEPALMAKFGSETKSSTLMMDVSLAALKNNPVKYITDTPGFFLFAHDKNPTYHDPLYLYNGTMKNECRVLGTITFCQPVIPTKFAFTVWDKLAGAVDFYYLNISRFVNFFLLFPAVVFALMRKDRFMKYVAVLYLASILFFTLTEAAIPRYTYIFTPLKTILIGYLLLSLGKYYHAQKN